MRKLLLLALIALGSCQLRSQPTTDTFKYFTVYPVTAIDSVGIHLGESVVCDSVPSTITYDPELYTFYITINRKMEIFKNLGNFPDEPGVIKLMAPDNYKAVLYKLKDMDVIQTEKFIVRLTNKKIPCD